MHIWSKYVLFLDDDIFIQTGYPLDLPSGSLGSYCIYEYHMPSPIIWALMSSTTSLKDARMASNFVAMVAS
ncbi:putative ceramide glucosyltransferase [Helianthus annuus]|nr:putative ceramide glucosyltransferase [Helianthus annuus]